MPFLPYLHRLMNRESLSAGDARLAMSAILAGDATTAQIAAFATALHLKGETTDELRGLAEAMRESSLQVHHGITGEPVLDTCGTGGDAQGTLNVSTLAAFVAAGAGVKVAKHGNRSYTSRCGSADLLEALGARIDLSPEVTGQAIREIGIGFLFAPHYHPAMKHAAQARAELKYRTAFNLLGPLTNPARATAQLVGAPSPRAAELMAMTLASLGLQRGYVVHGADGLDEISTTGPSSMIGILRGAIDHRIVTPEEFGVAQTTLDDLRGGDLEQNAAIARDVLDGVPGPHRDIVLVNSAAALMAAGRASAIPEAMALAAEAIDSGAARARLQAFVEFTRAAA
ncbi:MAG: anthranilate phosphoribosyltransferase [Bryobacteraceae bacterium]|nr:anthranilate phosphoribosyltransferase [Bryobacteraceae bacterium]